MMIHEIELPLVVFTVLTQWAVGIVCLTAFLEWIKPQFMKENLLKELRKVAILTFPLCAVGTLASLAHLGSPLDSYKALLALPNSWLSKEIAAFILINVLLLIYSYVWWKKPEKESARKYLGMISAVCGVIGILISAKVYFQMAIHPTWHSWTTFASFLLTGILLGGMTFLYVCSKVNLREEGAFLSKLLATLIYACLAIIVVVFYSTSQTFYSGKEGEMASGLSYASFLFWGRIVCTLILPAIAAFNFVIAKKPMKDSIALTLVLCTFAGEISGRILFYYSVMSQQPWF